MFKTLILQLNNPVVLQRVSARFASVVSLLLIIVCMYVLVQFIWLVVPQQKTVFRAPISSQNVSVNKQALQESYRRLVSANLFGENKKEVKKVESKDAPITRLNLILRGVLAATPASLASAIIAKGKTAKEEIYSVGDKISSGVAIKEIHPEHVVLDRSGSLEILKLQKISDLTLKPGQGFSVKSTDTSPAAVLGNIRQEIMRNPTSFGDYALPVPVNKDGHLVGYRLQPQTKGALLQQFGIEKNDILTEINGIKLNKPQNGIKALRQLSTAKTITIMVKRNGMEVPLSFTLN